LNVHRFDFKPTEEEIEEVNALFEDGDTRISTNFEKTGPVYREGDKPQRAFPIVSISGIRH